MKTVRIILSPEAEQVYKHLNGEAQDSKQERMILKSVNQKIELIKQNVHYGNPMAKELIPPEYKEKYETTNLFRVELPCFWRMIYTLTNDESVSIIAFVLDIFNHEDYNKKFGYENN